jgi:broad specificity phosphatase PhoE
MPTLTLVRHGRAARWGSHLDPPLDNIGRAQAAAMADALAATGPQPVVVSPMLRCRETAAPLCARWGSEPAVDPLVIEIPSPRDDLDGRARWLDRMMGATWAAADTELQPWRRGVVECLLGLDRDTVVVTHFMAINVAVGHATADPRVLCFRPDNCSRTILRSDRDTLTVVELGSEAETVVR